TRRVETAFLLGFPHCRPLGRPAGLAGAAEQPSGSRVVTAGALLEQEPVHAVGIAGTRRRSVPPVARRSWYSRLALVNQMPYISFNASAGTSRRVRLRATRRASQWSGVV